MEGLVVTCRLVPANKMFNDIISTHQQVSILLSFIGPTDIEGLFYIIQLT